MTVVRTDGLEDELGPIPVDLGVRYDPQTLIDYMAENDKDNTLRSIARQLQIDPAIMCRSWSGRQADKYATRLGAHPGAVWGASWWRPVSTLPQEPCEESQQVDEVEPVTFADRG